MTSDSPAPMIADRRPDEPCERGTIGCCIAHRLDPLAINDHYGCTDACQTW